MVYSTSDGPSPEGLSPDCRCSDGLSPYALCPDEISTNCFILTARSANWLSCELKNQSKIFRQESP